MGGWVRGWVGGWVGGSFRTWVSASVPVGDGGPRSFFWDRYIILFFSATASRSVV